VAIGYRACNVLTGGEYNFGLGAYALASLTSGDYNAGIGRDALYSLTTTNRNVGIGYRAGRYIVTGGGSAPNTTPSNSVYIGALTKPEDDGQANQVIIGYGAEGRGTNTTVVGSSSCILTHMAGAWLGAERSANPGDPDEGEFVLWMSDGSGSGDDGDIMIKITAGGSTKIGTVVDFSAL